MVNRDGLLEQYAYNDYANKLVLDVVTQLTDDELKREISPSHSSVHKLIYHMLGVEAFFFRHCQKRPFELTPVKLPTLADVRGYWHELEHQRLDFITTLDERKLTQIVDVEFEGHQLRYPKWQLLLQAFLHSTHHRGELAIILSELDHPLPTLDIIIHFTRQSGQQWPF